MKKTIPILAIALIIVAAVSFLVASVTAVSESILFADEDCC